MVKAILLAAGEGTRLRPITETRPKSMIPVLCRPLLEWHIRALLEAGADEIFVIVGYMKEIIEKFLDAMNILSSRVKTVYQDKPLGTGDAVIKASERIGYGEDVLITYSDLFLGDWGVYSYLTSIGENIIVGVKTNDPKSYGILYTEGSKLLKIIEKPKEALTNFVNAGIYKLNTSDILENKDVPLSPRGEVEFTDIVNKIAAEKEVLVYQYDNDWIDVGRPWHVIEANKIALKKIKSLIKGRIIDPVSIRGNIHIDEDSIVYPYTTVEGPVYVGKRVEIGPSAYVRPWSVICDGSKIGFSVEVKESVLFENVHVHHLSYIGDSVICENVNLGAGTILANLRFDEKTIRMNIKGILEDTGRRKLGAIIGANVKTGVNVSVMPGVKIGTGAWILPGSVIYRDVDSKTIYPPKATNRNVNE